MPGIGADRGAEIEHDRFALQRRPDRGNRRTLDPGHGPELELGHRHQRAGVAGGDRHVRLALLHRVDGEPHRGFPAPLAQRLARLVVHLDRHVGVHDTRALLEPRAGVDAAARWPRGRRTAGIRCRDGGRATVRLPERPPLPHGLPPWRRARCGLYGAWRDNSASAADTTGGSALRAASTLPLSFLQRGERRERMRRVIAGGRRLEYGVRLARIGIDAEKQELGRDRAEVDDAVDQHFRGIVDRDIDLAAVPTGVAMPMLRRRRAAAGTKTRSIGSSISFSIGSSVTTQVCSTVADTLPTTCRPLRPCSVTSKLAARRGKATSPASLAMAARAFASATRSRCRPVSGTSLQRDRHAPGRFRPTFGQMLGHALWLGHGRHPAPVTGRTSTCSRVGKGELAALETVLSHRLASRHSTSRSPPRAHRLPQAGAAAAHPPSPTRRQIHCARGRRQAGHHRVRRAPPGRPPAGHRSLADPAHLSRHRQIAHAHFTHAFVHVPAEIVEYALAELADRAALLQAPQKQHGMQHDHLETPVDRIRDAVDPVKCRRSRLCHDRAIERGDDLAPAGCGETGEISSG